MAEEPESGMSVTRLPSPAPWVTRVSEEMPGPSPAASRNLRLGLLLRVVDAVAVTVAWTTVAWIAGLVGLAAIGLVGAAVVTTLIGLSVQRLYRARECAVRAIEHLRIARSAVAGGLAALVVASVGPAADASVAMLTVAACGAAAASLTLFAGRWGYRTLVVSWRRRGFLSWPVVLIGTNHEALALQRLMADHPEHGFRIVGILGDLSEAAALPDDVPWLGRSADAPEVIERVGASGAVIAASALDVAELNALVRDLVDRGLHVRVSSGLLGLSHSRLRVAPVGHETLLYLERARLRPSQLRIKRTLDLVGATTALVLAAPVLLLASALIKLRDGGDVLFRQQRVGLGGEHFTLLKLRTMVPDAERLRAGLEAQNQRSGPLFKMAGDPRITPIGRILRETSLDELPQLWNVLRGEMSLVGPRPALPDEVAEFSERLLRRHQVKPGLTGLWQVEARDNPSFWSYERLDVFYVENWSVGLDLSIIAGTVGVVLGRAASPVLRVLRRRRRLPSEVATPVGVIE